MKLKDIKGNEIKSGTKLLYRAINSFDSDEIVRIYWSHKFKKWMMTDSNKKRYGIDQKIVDLFELEVIA